MPAGPKVGDKVGFIQLPTKPGPKPAEKPPASAVKLPARPGDGRGPDFTRRGDIRSVRSPYGAPARGTTPKGPAQQKGPAKAPEAPAPAKLAVTEDNILGPYYRAGAPFRAKVTPPLEPGTVLVINGRVWGHDTKKPLTGVMA